MARGKRRYTEEHIAFLRDNASLPRRELYELFTNRFGLDMVYTNFTRVCVRYGILTGRTGATGENHHRYKPIGSERIVSSGYIKIKTGEPSQWELKHVVVWESHNGPIPEGYVLAFKDSNKQNVDIDNLALISKKQRAVMNKLNLGNLPGELWDTAIMIVNLRMKQNERARDGRNG